MPFVRGRSSPRVSTFCSGCCGLSQPSLDLCTFGISRSVVPHAPLAQPESNPSLSFVWGFSNDTYMQGNQNIVNTLLTFFHDFCRQSPLRISFFCLDVTVSASEVWIYVRRFYGKLGDVQLFMAGKSVFAVRPGIRKLCGAPLESTTLVFP